MTTHESKELFVTLEHDIDEFVRESRRSVFSVSMIYLFTEMVIITGGNVFAFIFDVLLGTVIILVLTMTNVSLLALVIFLQTRPLQIYLKQLDKEDA